MKALPKKWVWDLFSLLSVRSPTIIFHLCCFKDEAWYFHRCLWHREDHVSGRYLVCKLAHLFSALQSIRVCLDCYSTPSNFFLGSFSTLLADLYSHSIILDFSKPSSKLLIARHWLEVWKSRARAMIFIFESCLLTLQ